MRPYLAILTDSFRAAFASRVLWIVLAALVVFLLSLAPVGYREVYTVDISNNDINSAERLTDAIARALNNEKATPAKNVAQALPKELQDRILEAAKTGEKIPRRGEYADAFNQLVKDDAWHDADLWKTVARFSELRELDELDTNSMEDRLRQRRARLRIEAAFPGTFRPRPERSIKVTYAVFETPFDLPVRKQKFMELLNQTVFPFILNNLFGIGAVFIGVLVTAPIIPEMFQPGSLHLLLSKPISRPALYLSKFLGGCAFVLLCETILVLGLYLIAGFRLDMWNHRLFLCIPVFVFLFAVYYSVSALAGLHWRSAIVSVVITALFWICCFIFGVASGLSESLVTDPAKVRSLIASQDRVFAATKVGALQHIGLSDKGYTAPLAAAFGRNYRILGPVRLQDGRIAASRIEFNPFNPFGADDAVLTVYDPQQQWKDLAGLKLPRGTTQLLPAPDGGIFVVTVSNIFHAPADQLVVDPEATENADKPQDSGGLFSGLQRLLNRNTEGFTAILPETLTLSSPNEVVLAGNSGDFVVYSAGLLYCLKKEANAMQWTVACQVSSEGDNTLTTHIAATNNAVLVARKGEPFRFYDLSQLKLIGELPSDDSLSIQSMLAAPSGEDLLAILSNGTVHQFNTKATPLHSQPGLPRQGHIEALAYDEQGILWLAHDIDRLTAFDTNQQKPVQQLTPARDFWRTIDAWLISPLRFVLPQTGEVSEVVVTLITGSKNLEIEMGNETQRVQLNVVRPLATCLGFTTVMLLLGCYYVYRQDF